MQERSQGAGKCAHILGVMRHLPSSSLKKLLHTGTIRRGLNKTCMPPARNLENPPITFFLSSCLPVGGGSSWEGRSKPQAGRSLGPLITGQRGMRRLPLDCSVIEQSTSFVVSRRNMRAYLLQQLVFGQHTRQPSQTPSEHKSSFL